MIKVKYKIGTKTYTQTHKTWMDFVYVNSNYSAGRTLRGGERFFIINGEDGQPKYAHYTMIECEDEKEVDFTKFNDESITFFMTVNFKFKNCGVWGYNSLTTLNGTLLSVIDSKFENVGSLFMDNVKGSTRFENSSFEGIRTFATYYRGAGKTNAIKIGKWKNVSFKVGDKGSIKITVSGKANNLTFVGDSNEKSTLTINNANNYDKIGHDGLNIENFYRVFIGEAHSGNTEIPDVNVNIKNTRSLELEHAFIDKSNIEVSKFEIRSERFQSGGIRNTKITMFPSEELFRNRYTQTEPKILFDNQIRDTRQLKFFEGSELIVNAEDCEEDDVGMLFGNDFHAMALAIMLKMTGDNAKQITEKVKYLNTVAKNAIMKHVWGQMMNVHEDGFTIEEFFIKFVDISGLYKLCGVDLKQFRITPEGLYE